MTVTPLPLPVPAGQGSVPAPMGPDAEASAETFAALVTQLLSGQGQQPGTELPVPGGGVPLTVVGEAVDDAAEATTDPGSTDPANGQPADIVPTAQPVTPQIAGFLAVLPVATALAAAAAPVAAADDLATTPVTSTPAAGAAEVTAADPTAAPIAGATATATPSATTAATAAATAGPTRSATNDTAPTPATSGEVAATEPEAGTPAPVAAGRPAERTADAAAPTAAPTTSTSMTGVSPAVGAESVAGPAGPATDTRPTPASPVTRQVFPEVTQLVSAGNGTHRLRLQLEPEALGEVRVILTVRNGEVHVRLAGGEEAQRALREGAPELRRLLELAGASDTRIVVRDLNSGSPSGNGSNANLTGQGPGGFGRGDSGVDQGGDRSQHQHAGTRGGGNAREGNNDGAVPHRLVQPATRTRLSGVDVSM